MTACSSTRAASRSRARSAPDGTSLTASERLEPLATAASPKRTLDCIAAFGRTDFRGDVAAIDVPTLGIQGDADQIVPFEVSGKRSHELIAGSELMLIEGGPHGINTAHPGEFNAALVEFLKNRCSSEGPPPTRCRPGALGHRAGGSSNHSRRSRTGDQRTV